MTDATTPTLGPDEKQCAGVPKLGLAPHVATKADFAKASAFKDGLYRICKVCDGQYQAAWRKAKAEAAGLPEPKPRAAKVAAAAAPVDGNGETVGVADARARFERATEVASPEQREQLMEAEGAAQAELVDIILAAHPAPKATRKPKAAGAKATPAPKPSAKAKAAKATK